MEIDREQFNWTQQDVIGAALLIEGGSIDSFNNPIDGNVFYQVGKHKVTGKVVILPTGRNMAHEFVNDVLKSRGEFN